MYTPLGMEHYELLVVGRNADTRGKVDPVFHGSRLRPRNDAMGKPRITTQGSVLATGFKSDNVTKLIDRLRGQNWSPARLRQGRQEIDVDVRNRTRPHPEEVGSPEREVTGDQ